MITDTDERFNVNEFHRQQAASLFNKVWEYMDKPSRTPSEEALMIHMAHGSR